MNERLPATVFGLIVVALLLKGIVFVAALLAPAKPELKVNYEELSRHAKPLNMPWLPQAETNDELTTRKSMHDHILYGDMSRQ